MIHASILVEKNSQKPVIIGKNGRTIKTIGSRARHGIEEFPYIRFTVWNKRMFELTGYTIDEINHSGWYSFVVHKINK